MQAAARACAFALIAVAVAWKAFAFACPARHDRGRCLELTRRIPVEDQHVAQGHLGWLGSSCWLRGTGPVLEMIRWSHEAGHGGVQTRWG